VLAEPHGNFKLRHSGQVFQEDVDGGATVNCKQTFFQHDGLEAN
jgi:hypothetical protein